METTSTPSIPGLSGGLPSTYLYRKAKGWNMLKSRDKNTAVGSIPFLEALHSIKTEINACLMAERAISMVKDHVERSWNASAAPATLVGHDISNTNEGAEGITKGVVETNALASGTTKSSTGTTEHSVKVTKGAEEAAEHAVESVEGTDNAAERGVGATKDSVVPNEHTAEIAEGSNNPSAYANTTAENAFTTANGMDTQNRLAKSTFLTPSSWSSIAHTAFSILWLSKLGFTACNHLLY